MYAWKRAKHAKTIGPNAIVGVLWVLCLVLW